MAFVVEKLLYLLLHSIMSRPLFRFISFLHDYVRVRTCVCVPCLFVILVNSLYLSPLHISSVRGKWKRKSHPSWIGGLIYVGCISLIVASKSTVKRVNSVPYICDQIRLPFFLSVAVMNSFLEIMDNLGTHQFNFK